MITLLVIGLIILSYILGYRVSYIRHSLSFEYLLQEIEQAQILGAKKIVSEIIAKEKINSRQNLYEIYEEVEKEIKKEFERI